MTTTGRKEYAVKAETLEEVLEILLSVDKDVVSLKSDVDRLTKNVDDARRIAVVAIITATSAVAFSAFSLWVR